ncbi:hypothetical protein [Acidovorax facilis]|uniref:hypothetical protein n=1 Tax=Acidovorax facilis TaxID=12917 RepID=UPI003D64C7A2
MSKKLIFILLPSIVISIWLISLFALQHVPERGTFGDMFGAVNALFTGLAFSAAGIAVYLQSLELSETRKELARSANALLDSSVVQARVLELQRLNAIASLKLKLIEIDASLDVHGKAIGESYREKIEAIIESLEGNGGAA